MAEEHKLRAQVLTPEGEVFDGEVEQLSTRTAVGDIGILANHAPLIGRLVPAELRLHVSDSETIRYAQAEGWLEVFANKAVVLIGEAIAPDELDPSELKQRARGRRGAPGRCGRGQRRGRAGRARQGACGGVPRGRREPLGAFRGWALASLLVDERALAEKLIAYETSEPEEIRHCAGFVKGWLEAREIEARQIGVRGLPVTIAEIGPADAPTVILHGHIDVVPGREGQFEPRVEGERLIGRGAYDMKGALAAMLLAMHDLRDSSPVRVRLGVVPDEESEEEVERGSDQLVKEGLVGDFAITGEPTDMHIGIQAKGVLAIRLRVSGRAAHGSTPWLGDNAILRALDVFRTVESLPFARQSSELFDRPSINLGRILGGDALNKVPDTCIIDVDIRYLPEQDPDRDPAGGG